MRDPGRRAHGRFGASRGRSAAFCGNGQKPRLRRFRRPRRDGLQDSGQHGNPLRARLGQAVHKADGFVLQSASGAKMRYGARKYRAYQSLALYSGRRAGGRHDAHLPRAAARNAGNKAGRKRPDHPRHQPISGDDQRQKNARGGREIGHPPGLSKSCALFRTTRRRTTKRPSTPRRRPKRRKQGRTQTSRSSRTSANIRGRSASKKCSRRA